jgi:phage terminase large subunit
MLTPAQYAITQGADLYDWQIDALEAWGNGWPVALLTCNGAGKTSVVSAWAMAWLYYAYPRAKAVATSGSGNQLQNQLWPAVIQHLPAGSETAMGSLPCKIRTPKGGVGIGFSTNDPGKAEGWHPTVSGQVDPVAIFVDEAKTVDDGIFTAFDRCTARFRLYTSSAGAPQGKFFDMFGKLSQYHWTMRVPYNLCPHIERENPGRTEKNRMEYGEDSWQYKSIELAEFVDPNSERLVLSPHQLTNALERNPKRDKSGEVVAFCDFAAGRDENVLAVRRGNSVKIIQAWKEKDTVQAARQFVELFKQQQLTAGQIWGDADGLGIGFINQFADMNWHINQYRGGQPAPDNEAYASLVSQTWHDAANQIKRGEIHLEEIDAITFDQITTRKSEWNNRGKLAVQSKETLPKSPDRGDAILGCIFCGAKMSGRMTASATIATNPSPFAARSVRGFNAL